MHNRAGPDAKISFFEERENPGVASKDNCSSQLLWHKVNMCRKV